MLEIHSQVLKLTKMLKDVTSTLNVSDVTGI